MTIKIAINGHGPIGPIGTIGTIGRNVLRVH